MFEDDTIHLLKQLYAWLTVDPNDIDEAKYLLLKKFSEVRMVLIKAFSIPNHRLDGFQYW